MTGEKLEVYFTTNDSRSFWIEIDVIPRIGEIFQKRGRRYKVVRIFHDYDDKEIKIAGELCE